MCNNNSKCKKSGNHLGTACIVGALFGLEAGLLSFGLLSIFDDDD